MVREILLLGDERLYQACREVSRGEAPELARWVEDLHDTLLDYRARHGAGRAVAAPQIGVMRRLIYMLTDRPYVFVNPRLSFPDGETCELLDDCMSFPGLLVRVRRHCRAVIDRAGRRRSWRAGWRTCTTPCWTTARGTARAGRWPPRR